MDVACGPILRLIDKLLPCPSNSSFQHCFSHQGLVHRIILLAVIMTQGKNSPVPEVAEHPPPDFETPNPYLEDRVENEDQQDGVRVAEAVTSSWSKKSLIITYAS